MSLASSTLGPTSPFGREVEIHFQDQTAHLTEVGATLRQYLLAGDELLDGYPRDQRSSDGRGQLLVPWPNRIRDGRYQFAGTERQLGLSEPDRQTAIHGLVRWSNWTFEEVSQDRASLGLLLFPQPGYDFSLELKVTYQLGPGGLSHLLLAKNIGSSPLPFGAGAHPYLRLPGVPFDKMLLRSRAELYLEADQRGIPTGRELSVTGTAYDFREPRPLQGRKLDTAFTGLAFEDGKATVELTDPDSSRRLLLWVDQTHPHLMLFTGDSLPDPAVRRRGLGVEPMTCAPNAFQNGKGLLILEPGESYQGSWGIQLL